jgi:hypothetical protein
MSGASQLATWFPTTDASPMPSANLMWRPIPIHTVPTELDSILRPFDEGKVPQQIFISPEFGGLLL